MGCHCAEELELHAEAGEQKILLMGNPNVGKSVIFSKLTGMEVISSNYVGTTVGFTIGKTKLWNYKGVLVDVPGTYSLEATSQAEEVAIEFLKKSDADVVICVLDATNLERNLNLALQIQEYGIPTVFSLNLADVAERQGIQIDVKKLEKLLNAPVIPTVAIRNLGLKELLLEAFKLGKAKEEFEKNVKIENLSSEERWSKTERIAEEVQHIEPREPTLLEKLGDMSMKPFPGLPMALLVMILSLGIVVGGGKGLRAGILLPLINGIIVPFITKIVSQAVPEGILLNILVGEYGVLVKGIEWPFALILPYVLLFYIVLSFLEDSGYLPRLGVLVDGVLKRFGVQGGNIVPFMMGYGCAVPAILGTRAATTHKERVIVATLVSLAVPCVAQTGAFISLLGGHSALVLALVYLISFAAIITAGMTLNKLIPGQSDPMLLEIPNLLWPDRQSLLKKIWMRTRDFMVEAELPMILGIAFAALVAETGILNAVSHYLAPVTQHWLGLPEEATLGLLLGVIRRELAVLPLLELNLNTLQLLVGSVVALFYLPCLSVLGVLIKEFGMKTALAIGAFTFIAAFVVGGLINQIGSFIIALV